MGKKVIVIITTIILAIGLVSCAKEDSNKQLSRTELFMGTTVKVTLYDNASEKLLDDVFKRVSEVEDLVSINKEGTEVGLLNENAGIKGVKLSYFSYNLIKKALKYSKLSHGGYDVSIGPLVKLWSIGLPEANVPSEDDIKEVIKNIDYTKVKMNDSTKEVFLSEKGMMIDLGSIAKGYIADDIAKLLKKNNVERAIIDLGGNIYAMGTKDKEHKWKIGIQNPFEDRGNVIGTIEIANKSVVTTGVYERFIEKDGIKYHHILNPKTGYPYKTDIAGVTIVADESVDADALSTLIFTKGLDEGLKFLDELETAEAIFVMNNSKVYITKGLKGNFKIVNDSFELSN
ncbi:FAD:protein FMN transferase [Clostridium sp. CCUG 7971]|uniref:FAD:protein FMN transferase n=1 Tax=Clostridium sp. CCUG 7971 TaxID=2811414 RepID=UPI001ABA395A|nr:FAD:protein FMN transferase [Clostridium sp. CCUG 7971]MBO3445490.1 FAD:protein FMN transferase [Clostridium sp. CCUG 7971]